MPLNSFLFELLLILKSLFSYRENINFIKRCMVSPETNRHARVTSKVFRLINLEKSIFRIFHTIKKFLVSISPSEVVNSGLFFERKTRIFQLLYRLINIS